MNKRENSQKLNLSPSEYEKFVEELIKRLSFSQNAKIYRNKEFIGVRQAGKYEIDIALEISLDALDFLIIIECKNRKRPIDRPIIQNFAQTKDAISAHKAVVVSPIGFTKEAVEVAKSLGIALWVISKVEWIKVYGYGYNDKTEELVLKLRNNIIDKLKIRYEYLESFNDIALINYKSTLEKTPIQKLISKNLKQSVKPEIEEAVVSPINQDKPSWLNFRHFRDVGTHRISHNLNYLCDGDAISEIIDDILICKHPTYASLLKKVISKSKLL